MVRLVAAPAPSRLRYRVRQFTRGLRPHLAPSEVVEARERLTPEEFRLFLHARPRDRRHSMDLFHLLLRQGVNGRPPSEEVLVAALLHDVGKGEIDTWHRVAFVVLDGVSPALVSLLASRQGARWRRALWRLRHHGALSAEMLRRVGASSRVVAIVEAHTQPDSDDPEIAAFIRADDSV